VASHFQRGCGIPWPGRPLSGTGGEQRGGNQREDVYGTQIADHAFAFLLAPTRKLNVTIPRQHLEERPSGRDGMFELDGKTAVIIGVGGIGSQIAQRARARA
jgi:phosphoglycerate dehydrogenase-like enzyme